MNIDNIETHVQHCCIIHGCKYTNLKCPVLQGIPQDHPCGECKRDGIIEVEDVLRAHKGDLQLGECPLHNTGEFIMIDGTNIYMCERCRSEAVVEGHRNIYIT